MYRRVRRKTRKIARYSQKHLSGEKAIPPQIDMQSVLSCETETLTRIKQKSKPFCYTDDTGNPPETDHYARRIYEL